LSAARAIRNADAFQTLMRRTSAAMFAAAIVAGLLVLVGAPWGLRWLGTGFQAASVPLAVLLVGRCVASAFGPALQTLPLVGRPRQVPIYLAIGLAIQAIFGVILIPFDGAIAAAAVRSVAAIVCAQLATATTVQSSIAATQSISVQRRCGGGL
jgi:O-antigen/teichoic acid export membrane protein